MAQTLRPDSLISADNWTGTYTAVDETTPVDTPNTTEYCFSQNNPGGSIFELGLSNPAATPSSGTYTVRYRHAQIDQDAAGSPPNGGGTATALVFSIIQGTTVIASDTQQAPTGTWTTRVWTPDLSAVTDWNDVRVRAVPTGGTGNPTNRRAVGLSWIEVEVPDGATAQNLTPSLFSNGQTFFSPTVVGSRTLSPGLFTNTQTIFTHTVARGAVSLVVPLLSNTQTFYAGSVSITATLEAPLLTNAPLFFAPSVSGVTTALPPLLGSTGSFFAPTVQAGAAGVSPPLFTNVQTFYSASVAAGGAEQSLTASLFTNTQTIHAPAISAANDLGVPLLGSAASFFTATLETENSLVAGLFDNNSTIFPPTALIGAVTVEPPLLGSSVVFFGATVPGGVGDSILGHQRNKQVLRHNENSLIEARHRRAHF